MQTDAVSLDDIGGCSRSSLNAFKPQFSGRMFLRVRGNAHDLHGNWIVVQALGINYYAFA